jgi:outer membrane protein OmpA-like peptidoglycan-associated protein
MRTLLLSVCLSSLLASAAIAQTADQATPPPVQCVGAEGVVYFDLGSARLDAEDETSLREIADARRTQCTTQITLTGHTDATGSIARNRQLAQQRAEAVRERLISLGVPQEEIAIAAAGEAAPQSQTEDRLNRRVTIVLAASPRPPADDPAT